jgi:hypothetical protein
VSATSSISTARRLPWLAAHSFCPSPTGKQDVPDRYRLGAFIAHASGNSLAGFAEADEANRRLLVGHGDDPRLRPFEPVFAAAKWHFFKGALQVSTNLSGAAVFIDGAAR